MSATLNPKPATRNIYLIGFMGSGKTTAGKHLALKLGYDFLDLDRCIAAYEQKSIATIFNESGEPAFRLLEKNYLLQTFQKTNTVVSCGGGTPCFFDNMEMMNAHGITIYLQMSAKELYSRLKNAKTERPLLAGKTETELLDFIDAKLQERQSFYNQATISVSGINLNYQMLIDALNRL